MEFKEKLLNVQKELKANKGQYNSFSKFYYRSAEDILEAVKPLLVENKLTLIISDDVKLIGDRYYVEATAELMDTESEKSQKATAYAREPENKKGMDSSQITGAASSYARKYALNGLFAIDDNKDADSMDNRREPVKKEPVKKKETKEQSKQENADEVTKMFELAKEQGVPLKDVQSEMFSRFSKEKTADLTISEIFELSEWIYGESLKEHGLIN